MDIDHEYTEEVVCPYCGLKSVDSHEYFLSGDEDVEVDCECGKTFLASRNYSITYNTIKKKEMQP